MPWWINESWNWFWYYRRGKIKYRVLEFGSTFNASASNGIITVYNCYGGTPEQAKEMAAFKLKKALEREEMLENDELVEEVVHQHGEFTLKRIKPPTQ
ncbi:hypothetical protein [Bacillus sp. FJAT-29814]|uniref:hypothetical protein n=1 Tax=Bacillus sp. FJAT-29814 TaxID=1729688 RepID=UPI00082D9C61|nr:hypothetical protein [Bacillus sp. FJAT-29814]